MKTLNKVAVIVSWIGVTMLLFMIFVIIYCIVIIGHVPNYYDASAYDLNLHHFTYPFLFCYILQRIVLIFQAVLLLPRIFNKGYKYRFILFSLLVQFAFYIVTEFTVLERFVLWAIG